ncbi:hypothetical protein RHP75_06740 [Pseudomonas sp. SG20056]|uniref:P-loop ATPase, Sll1717 family n=1 Tax=Pseudomonas sp. SG20056 TaxID=3074146 RepID=UPI00287F778D|nr:hypothetical protein [Pseudomonas sp. SG20056]WNF48119.1 hypothetical protein RHP75_06740 [Pseudomonas sp. SG20056]
MVFHDFAKKRKSALYFGAPEAEAESLPTSKVSLRDVYEDHHDLFTELSNEKFIIIGRKGCGKSAFAEYASAVAGANLFCSFIRQDNISLEQLVQLGTNAGLDHTKDQLFKWLIYTNLLKQFCLNESVQNAQPYKLLNEFIKKNSGYIEINKDEVTELIRRHKFEVSIEHFKRFFKGKYNRDVELKESRAPYYKLLPHLELVVIDVLKNKLSLENKNSYAIFFDDLDIGFKANNSESVDTLLSLIRTAKHVNNTVFAKNGAPAKVVILIRDDIERLLSPLGSDISKIFSSYGVQLNWYQDEFIINKKEDEIGLKKLINKRTAHAFKNAGIPMSGSKPWESLIEDDFRPKSSFKYVADHTFLRPRDFILLFKPLETGGYSIPLNKSSINQLIGQYASEMIKELSNELSSFYEPDEIENIILSLKNIGNVYDCTYTEAINIICENCYLEKSKASNILDDLFNRSIIGTVNPQNKFVRFKHKISKKDAQEYSIDKDSCIILHSGIKIYLQNR